MDVLGGFGYFQRYRRDSYRGQKDREGKTSLTALQVLLPFTDQLETRSVNYILGSRSRHTWFYIWKRSRIELNSDAWAKIAMSLKV